VKSEYTDLIYNWSVVEGNIDLSDKNVAPFGTNHLQLYIEVSTRTICKNTPETLLLFSYYLDRTMI
jgi:hypothetical protein